MQDKTLMILHIPKAAGTTLRWIMDRQYSSEQVYKIKGDIKGDCERLATLEDKHELRVVFGHFVFGLHESLAPLQQYTYVTVMREPTKRVVSLYSYTRTESPAHYLARPAREMNLHDFVTSGVTRHTDNGMVRQLCGEDQFTMHDGRQVPYNDALIPFRGVTRQHLELAKHNLSEHFSVVGFAENFDEMLEQMRKKFAWRVPRYERRNVSRKRVEPDARAARAIVALNQFDYELYKWARERF